MKILFVHPGRCSTRTFSCGSSRSASNWWRRPRGAGTQSAIDLQVESHDDYHRMIASGSRISSPSPATTSPTCRRSSIWRARWFAALLHLRRRPQRLLHRAAPFWSTARAPSTACSRARARPAIVKLLEAVGGDRSAIAKVPGAVTARRRGTAAGLRRAPRRHQARARSAAPPPQIFHRRARPLRLDRVLARLPVGLLVLQRLDVLRPQLSAASARSGWSRISPSIREPGVFIVDDVAFIQDEHGFAIGEAIARKGIRKNYYLETRGDVLLAQQGGVPVLEDARRSPTCSSASRRSTRRACASSASASRSGAISRRWSSPARSASRWRSTSSPTRTGTRSASASCASGAWRCRRS